MENTLKVLHDLYGTKGRKAKEQILKEHSNDEYLKSIFEYSMSSDVVTGISEKSFTDILDKKEFFYTYEQESELWKDNDFTGSKERYKNLAFFINTLSRQHNTSPSNEVISILSDIFSKCSPVERYWYYRIVIQNLNIDVGAVTVNNVFKGLITQYTPMLADSGIAKFDKWVMTTNDKYCVDTKIDGLRLTIFIRSNNIKVRTRSGKYFYPLQDYFNDNLLNEPYIQKAITGLFPEFQKDADETKEGFVLDCEILDRDGSWESSVSLVNVNDVELTKIDDVSGVPTEVPAFTLKCFDLINLNPFNPENFGKPTKTLDYKRRRELLEGFIKNMPDKFVFKYFDLTNMKTCDTLEEAQAIAMSYIDNGYEGAVVKHPRAFYICGRKDSWLKIKNIQTFDGVITEVIPGELSGKYSNMAGKLMVKCYVGDNEITGTIGTGFTDTMRKYLWDNKEQVIGKVIEFTMLSKTVNDNFRSGVFKGFREDKKEGTNAE